MKIPLAAGIVGLMCLLAGPAREDESQSSFVHPLIGEYGEIVLLPEAAEPPRNGSRVVFDITSQTGPDQVNRGLDRVARFLNLCAGADVRPADVKVALVVHGSSTVAVLKDDVYADKLETSSNPNLPLLRALKDAGVELYVCGQALAHQGFSADEVAPEVSIAVAAMTVNVNKQLDGYAYLPIR